MTTPIFTLEFRCLSQEEALKKSQGAPFMVAFRNFKNYSKNEAESVVRELFSQFVEVHMISATLNFTKEPKTIVKLSTQSIISCNDLGPSHTLDLLLKWLHNPAIPLGPRG